MFATEIYSCDRPKEQSPEYLYLASYSWFILLFVLQTEVRNVGLKVFPDRRKMYVLFCRSRVILALLNYLDRFQILRRRKSEDLGIEIKFPV
jgi:hypothetical protein